MIRVLADSECLLSYFTNQKHSIEETEKLFELLESRKIEVYFIDKCLNDLKYYLSIPDKFSGQKAIERIEKSLSHYIISINREIIEEARKLPLNDFDSALELTCAKQNNLGAILKSASLRNVNIKN